MVFPLVGMAASAVGRFAAAKLGGEALKSLAGKEIGGKALGGILGQGAALGGASYAASEGAKRFMGSDEGPDKDQKGQQGQEQNAQAAPQTAQMSAAPMGQMGPMAPVGMANPYGVAMPMAPGMVPGAGYMAPGVPMGQVPYTPIAAAGAAAMAPAAATTATGAQPQTHQASAFAQEKSFGKSAMGTALAAAAGGVGGLILKSKEDDHTPADLIKGALSGAGTGAFAKMANTSIQEQGGGLMAGLNTGIASAFGSTLQKGGPGALQSALMGAGAGGMSNLAHDKLALSGKGALADAVGGAGLGGVLGYTLDGEGKDAGIAALGGGGLGALTGASNEAGGLSELVKNNGLSKLLGGDKGDKGAESATPTRGDEEPQLA